MQAKGANTKRGASKVFLPTTKQSTLSPEQRQITSFFGQGRQGAAPGKTPIANPNGAGTALATKDSSVLAGLDSAEPVDLEAPSPGSQEGDGRSPPGVEGQG